MIDNAQLEKIFAYYKTQITVAGSSENLFYSVYDLIPGENVTISKIKRILPDVQSWTRGKCSLDIEDGIKLKIEHEKRPMLFSYDFTREISENMRPEILPLIIGEDETGKRLFYDLTKMPHLLIGGSTGSGKSVFIHNCILSLMYGGRSSIILVDVKRVEFTLYKDIPQLANSICFEVSETLTMLKNLCFTMDNRYKLLESHSCRNIEEYQKNGGKMQYITLFIDELADLVMQNQKIEHYLIRLAQLGRAAGIHLIVATQRPDASIISGLIRANIPSRICFAVQKATDSRIILDQSGGENLRGGGDGLFIPIGSKKAIHFQGPYTSTSAIKQITDIARKA